MKPPGANLGDPGAAAWTGLAALVVHGQEVTDLLVERWRDADLEDLDRTCQGRPGGVEQRVHLLGRQAGTFPERQEPSGVEDLVAVGIADSGDERLVPQQVLELAGVPADPIPPSLEGERRIVGVGTLVGLAESGNLPGDPGGLQVDLAHLGGVPIAHLDREVVRRHPAGALGPRGGVGRA